MPALPNPRHEAFAQACARGARIGEAHEDAGFVPDRGHASRLARDAAVAERIAEPRGQNEALTGASLTGIIAALLRAAKTAEAAAAASPATLKEVRQTLLEVRRLSRELSLGRESDRGLIHVNRRMGQ